MQAEWLERWILYLFMDSARSKKSPRNIPGGFSCVLRMSGKRFLKGFILRGGPATADGAFPLGRKRRADTAAYLRLRRLVGRRELEQVGKKYYLPGTVVREEKQWEGISAYLQEAGFAYCQDVAELLHVGKRKTAGILRRMVRDGQLLQFEKRYYLAKQPGQKQIQ